MQQGLLFAYGAGPTRSRHESPVCPPELREGVRIADAGSITLDKIRLVVSLVQALVTFELPPAVVVAAPMYDNISSGLQW